MGKLTAISVKTALATPGTYQDGDGLFLKMKLLGSACWFLRIRRDGRRRDTGIRSAKLVMLAMAREKALELRVAAKAERRDVLAERKDAATARIKFREAAIQYHAENEGSWKSQTYARTWLAALLIAVHKDAKFDRGATTECSPNSIGDVASSSEACAGCGRETNAPDKMPGS